MDTKKINQLVIQLTASFYTLHFRHINEVKVKQLAKMHVHCLLLIHN